MLHAEHSLPDLRDPAHLLDTLTRNLQHMAHVRSDLTLTVILVHTVIAARVCSAFDSNAPINSMKSSTLNTSAQLAAVV